MIASNLTTVELVKEITSQVGLLAKKQIELAKAELRANIRAEAFTVGGLGVAALSAICTLNLLFVTAALALTRVMPAWMAGLVVTGFLLVFTAIAGAVSWSRRVRSRQKRTRHALGEDLRVVKERHA